jgi:hypothetical protein
MQIIPSAIRAGLIQQFAPAAVSTTDSGTEMTGSL